MSTDIATQIESPMATVDASGDLAFMTNKAAFEHLWRVATSYARSQMVPQHFQGKVDDCFIICQLAVRLKCDPFMLMQGMYVVHGRPGMEAKLQIALANTRGPFKGPIQYRMSGSGKSRSCTAYATHGETGETVEMEVTMDMAEKEGWMKPKGTQVSKWVTLPELMLRYRAASFLIRLFCPDVVMGIQTKEELDDAYIDATPKRLTAADLLGGTVIEEQTPQDDRTETLKDYPSPADPNPGVADDSADVAQWLVDIESCEDIAELTTSLKAVEAKAWKQPAKNNVIAAINARIEALRPKRGERSQ